MSSSWPVLTDWYVFDCRVGDPELGWSDEFNFTMPPEAHQVLPTSGCGCYVAADATPALIWTLGLIVCSSRTTHLMSLHSHADAAEQWAAIPIGAGGRFGADGEQRAHAGAPDGQQARQRAQCRRLVVCRWRAAEVGHLRPAGAAIDGRSAPHDHRGAASSGEARYAWCRL